MKFANFGNFQNGQFQIHVHLPSKGRTPRAVHDAALLRVQDAPQPVELLGGEEDALHRQEAHEVRVGASRAATIWR